MTAKTLMAQGTMSAHEKHNGRPPLAPNLGLLPAWGVC